MAISLLPCLPSLMKALFWGHRAVRGVMCAWGYDPGDSLLAAPLLLLHLFHAYLPNQEWFKLQASTLPAWRWKPSQELPLHKYSGTVATGRSVAVSWTWAVWKRTFAAQQGGTQKSVLMSSWVELSSHPDSTLKQAFTCLSPALKLLRLCPDPEQWSIPRASRSRPKVIHNWGSLVKNPASNSTSEQK